MDMLEQITVTELTEQLHDAFKSAIKNHRIADASYEFWVDAVHITHAQPIDGQRLSRDQYFALKEYYEELADWLKLNYPSNHWRPVGIYTREQFILSVH